MPFSVPDDVASNFLRNCGKCENLEAIKSALAKHPDLLASMNSKKETGLHLAILNSKADPTIRKEILDCLFQHLKNVFADPRPFFTDDLYPYTRSIILKAQDKNGDTLLHYACRIGDAYAIEELFSCLPTQYLMLIQNRQQQLAVDLISNETTRTDIPRLLIQRAMYDGISEYMGKKGRGPNHEEALLSFKDCMERSGLDPENINFIKAYNDVRADCYGKVIENSLADAISICDLDTIKWYQKNIRHVSNILLFKKSGSEGAKTAFEWALSNSLTDDAKLDCVKAILESPGLILIKNSSDSPFNYTDDPEIIKALLLKFRHNTDLWLEINEKGKSFIEYAVEYGHTEILARINIGNAFTKMNPKEQSKLFKAAFNGGQKILIQTFFNEIKEENIFTLSPEITREISDYLAKGKIVASAKNSTHAQTITLAIEEGKKSFLQKTLEKIKNLFSLPNRNKTLASTPRDASTLEAPLPTPVAENINAETQTFFKRFLAFIDFFSFKKKLQEQLPEEVKSNNISSRVPVPETVPADEKPSILQHFSARYENFFKREEPAAENIVASSSPVLPIASVTLPDNGTVSPPIAENVKNWGNGFFSALVDYWGSILNLMNNRFQSTKGSEQESAENSTLPQTNLTRENKLSFFETIKTRIPFFSGEIEIDKNKSEPSTEQQPRFIDSILSGLNSAKNSVSSLSSSINGFRNIFKRDPHPEVIENQDKEKGPSFFSNFINMLNGLFYKFFDLFRSTPIPPPIVEETITNSNRVNPRRPPSEKNVTPLSTTNPPPLSFSALQVYSYNKPKNFYGRLGDYCKKYSGPKESKTAITFMGILDSLSANPYSGFFAWDKLNTHINNLARFTLLQTPHDLFLGNKDNISLINELAESCATFLNAYSSKGVSKDTVLVKTIKDLRSHLVQTGRVKNLNRAEIKNLQTNRVMPGEISLHHLNRIIETLKSIGELDRAENLLNDDGTPKDLITVPLVNIDHVGQKLWMLQKKLTAQIDLSPDGHEKWSRDFTSKKTELKESIEFLEHVKNGESIFSSEPEWKQISTIVNPLFAKVSDSLLPSVAVLSPLRSITFRM